MVLSLVTLMPDMLQIELCYHVTDIKITCWGVVYGFYVYHALVFLPQCYLFVEIWKTIICSFFLLAAAFVSVELFGEIWVQGSSLIQGWNGIYSYLNSSIILILNDLHKNELRLHIIFTTISPYIICDRIWIYSIYFIMVVFYYQARQSHRHLRTAHHELQWCQSQNPWLKKEIPNFIYWKV